VTGPLCCHSASVTNMAISELVPQLTRRISIQITRILVPEYVGVLLRAGTWPTSSIQCFCTALHPQVHCTAGLMRDGPVDADSG
jgi:hypothetical protein